MYGELFLLIFCKVICHFFIIIIKRIPVTNNHQFNIWNKGGKKVLIKELYILLLQNTNQVGIDSLTNTLLFQM